MLSGVCSGGLSGRDATRGYHGEGLSEELKEDIVKNKSLCAMLGNLDYFREQKL